MIKGRRRGEGLAMADSTLVLARFFGYHIIINSKGNNLFVILYLLNNSLQQQIVFIHLNHNIFHNRLYIHSRIQ